MRYLILVALLVAVPAHALTISVPADMPSVQQALDAAPDTVVVGAAYALAEDVAISHGVVLIGEGGTHPALGHVTLWMPDQFVTGNVYLERLSIAGTSGTSGMGQGQIYLEDCLSTSTVQLRYGRIEINTLHVSPGYGVDAEGTSAHVQLNDVHVSDVPGAGITAKGGEAAVFAQDCVVERCGQGIVYTGYEGSGQKITNCTIRDCVGEGILNLHSVGQLRGNRIERCGRGIVTAPDWGGGPITGNVVIDAAGDGIVSRGYATLNTVVNAGGNGITALNGAWLNLVAYCAGVGLSPGTGENQCNLLWGNGSDVRTEANVFADPQFCDLAGGDLRVASSSPALGGACGQIGALGAGCDVRWLAAAPEDGKYGETPAEFGVRTRGRIALVSLAGPEPATLDVIDVAGRRLSRTVLTSSREVRLDAPAGVVFLRLRQGERGAVVKTVVLD